ncbi:hypothetical protein [Burkholderia vietnamiensis]|uniref:hypothetical protein n=1 Tax=Burkholderia vietnamiensis TaxID=60552 RepID=UPI000753C272|nr:hypothetical protein [Burkholderia vietnamiensis]KVE72455.1 hypothetical protein WI98_01080 [Burkholderia vietnamiensis]
MLLVICYTLFICIGCSLVWRILDFGCVARSPFLIAVVGMAICASGFFIQTQIHQSEGVPTWLAEKVPLFSVDHAVLDFFNKLVEVIIYAVGGGVIASALLLRAQFRFAQERNLQIENKACTEERITQLEHRLTVLPADDDSGQFEAIFTLLKKQKKRLEKTTRILRVMGE